ncbi:hypothetical protein HY249_02675 [Candidatus Azambacteria bacterium]|nr:hypothetical protein [Candidatus Azambacteria bacterium]
MSAKKGRNRKVKMLLIYLAKTLLHYPLRYQLTGIPAEIGQLKYLESLDLSFNKIDTMPNEIENIKGNLKILNLKGNLYSQESIKEIQKKLPNTQIIY